MQNWHLMFHVVMTFEENRKIIHERVEIMHVDIIYRSLQLGLKVVLVWVLNGWIQIILILNYGDRGNAHRWRPALLSFSEHPLQPTNSLCNTPSALTDWPIMAILRGPLSQISTKKFPRPEFFIHHIVGNQPCWKFPLVTPTGYHVKGWTELPGRNREKPSLWHVGSLECVRLLKVIFPCFSLKLLEVHVMEID